MPSMMHLFCFLLKTPLLILSDAAAHGPKLLSLNC
jgi:hypothetical protein